MMKIAILAPIAWRTPPRHYGPWEEVASGVAEGMVSRGLDVTLFATGDSITAGKLIATTPAPYGDDDTADVKVLECLHISEVMERARDFDLIHNHYDFLPLTYSRLIPVPMITTIHGFSSEKIIPVYEKYNTTGNYVSISNSNRHAGLDYIATVYNGINVDKFTYQANPEDYLLFFGRLHPEKGALQAIQLARLTGRRLIMAGLIQEASYYVEQLLPLIDGEQISYVGNVDAVERDKLLGGAAALLHLIQFDEPFGLSVAEAMCCGTPVIANRRGSMPELVKHGVTGFLVSSEQEAVQAVADLPSLYRNDCREWAMSQFSKEKMTNDYLEVYERVLGR